MIGAAHHLQWAAAGLLLVAGLLLLLLPAGEGDPQRRRNRRTAGALFLFSGAIFTLLASGLLGRLFA